MATINDLMNAIARQEGFNVAGSLAQRNNNPGNLRSGVGQSGSSGGYAVFATPQDGWNALQNQIEIDSGRGLSLRDFIYKYAPPSENNTSAYLTNVVSWLGLSTPDISLDAIAGGGGGGNVQVVPNVPDIGGGSSFADLVDSSLSVSSLDLSSMLDNNWVAPVAIGMGVAFIWWLSRG
jgi:hypothetical protein